MSPSSEDTEPTDAAPIGEPAAAVRTPKPSIGVSTSQALSALFLGGAALLVAAGVASAVVISKRPRPAATMALATIPAWPKEPEGLHAPIPECAAYDAEMAKCVSNAPEKERAGWESVRQTRNKQFSDALTYLTTVPARDALKAACGAAKKQAEICSGRDVESSGRKPEVGK